MSNHFSAFAGAASAGVASAVVLLFEPELALFKAPSNAANPSVPEDPEVDAVLSVVAAVVFFEVAPAPFKAPSKEASPFALPVPLAALAPVPVVPFFC